MRALLDGAVAKTWSEVGGPGEVFPGNRAGKKCNVLHVNWGGLNCDLVDSCWSVSDVRLVQSAKDNVYFVFFPIAASLSVLSGSLAKGSK